MAINLTKTYAALLEIDHFSESERKASLMRIFQRDIEDCAKLTFNNKQIRPVKGEIFDLDQVYKHLTTETIYKEGPNKKKVKTRQYEPDRSKRLHWVKYHIDLTKADRVIIFSAEERVDEKNVIRTYIYDTEQEYVVVLQPQNSGKDYYLITAYHLNRKEGLKAMNKRLKRKLPDLH